MIEYAHKLSDKARLDLMEKHGWRVFVTGAMDWQCNGPFGHIRGGSPREVMDKAMEAQKRFDLEAQS